MVIAQYILLVLAIVYIIGYTMTMNKFFATSLNRRKLRTLHAFCIAIVWPITLIEDHQYARQKKREWKEMLRKYYPVVYKKEYGVDPREEK